MKSQSTLEKELRDSFLDLVLPLVKENYDDVMWVGENELTMPVLDSEGNEKYLNIIIKTPRGKRVEGTYYPYDGYEAAAIYAEEKEYRSMINNGKE